MKCNESGVFVHQLKTGRAKISRSLVANFGWRTGWRRGDILLRRATTWWSISADAIFARPRARRKTQSPHGGGEPGARRSVGRPPGKTLSLLAQSLGHPLGGKVCCSFIPCHFSRMHSSKRVSELRMEKNPSQQPFLPGGDRPAAWCTFFCWQDHSNNVKF